MDTNEFLFKVVIIGEAYVGKTNLLYRFRENEFLFETKATIGIDHSTYDTIIDNKRICAHFWDTSGQEKFRGLTSAYYKNCQGIVLVYDISNRISFDHLSFWVDEINTYCEKDVQIILLGNKSDLNKSRCISEEEGRNFANDSNLDFFEVSAKENKEDCVIKAFNHLLAKIVKVNCTEDKKKKILDGISLRRNSRKSILARTSRYIQPQTKSCC